MSTPVTMSAQTTRQATRHTVTQEAETTTQHTALPLKTRGRQITRTAGQPAHPSSDIRLWPPVKQLTRVSTLAT
jgi:hypothetical protein